MASLDRRPLGATGLTVSRLGLAALSVPSWTGGPRLSPVDVERAFHEHGVTTFLVHSLMPELCEGVRRLVKAGHRDELVLISESSLPFAWSVRGGLEKQVKLLGVERLDAWLVGWVRSRWGARAAVWDAMRRLQQRGLTRAIGFSSHDRRLAAALAVELPADVVMIRYNAAHRGAEREIFAPLAALGAKRPGVIAYTATRWGMLLQPQAGFERPMTAGECYRFALSHPLVDMVWCAATSAQQLAEDVAAVREGPLEATRLDEVRRFGDAVHASARRGRRWMFGPTAG